MMQELNYTQEKVSERMGKDRSTVANYIRLLDLPPAIQAAVRKGSLSVSLAKILIGKEIDQQLFLFKEIIEKGLTVRQTEELVRKMNSASGKAPKTSKKNELSPVYKKLEDKLASHLSAKVVLVQQKNGSGTITISYQDINGLNTILDAMQVSIS
jgi:ParB family chromosome partitioning protein